MIATFAVLFTEPITLRAESEAPGLLIRTSRSTGLATFVSAVDPGGFRLNAKAVGAGREPDRFLAEHGRLFGVRDPARELAPGRVRTDALGQTRSTYHQRYAGVPVFSGVIHVHQNRRGRVRAANGHFHPVPAKLSTQPTLAGDQAEAAARKLLAVENPLVEHSELVVVDPGWYGDLAIGPHLAYHIVLSHPPDPVREAFFIDAHSGAVLDRWSMIHAAIERRIHSGDGGMQLPGRLVRTEGSGPSGESEVDRAYDYAGDTYAYFQRAFGRDSLDDLGLALNVTVNSAAPSCPNAFWNGQALVFCNGLVTDDILAHEMTHGVTEYTAGLIYQNQPGQLNESISDIFGELVDLFNGDVAVLDAAGPRWPVHPTGPGTDSPNQRRTACSPRPAFADGYRWLMGEDASGRPFRDMWSPTCFSHPDTANSPLQTCEVLDGGGVHTGSGIPNHAFAIMCDGKEFGGYAVEGIGPVKAGAVWYRALTTYLSIASDFEDAYAALNQAAEDLVGTFPNDPRTGEPIAEAFTTKDAEQVDAALRAVEMNTPGRCGSTVPLLDPGPPPSCGEPREIVFADDFETDTQTWTTEHTNPPTPYNWERLSSGLPLRRSGTVWHCDDPEIGDCILNDESAVHSLISPELQAPERTERLILSFTHYLASEALFDGGNVKISVNRGDWQLVPADAFDYNPYNTTIVSYYGSARNTNPLAGQPGWSGAGGGWGTSVINLGRFVSGGDTFRLRFDFGKDGCAGLKGWYLDDVLVVNCPPSPPVAQDIEARTPAGVPVHITLTATRDGQPPAPGTLTTVVTTLPAHGLLRDPSGAAIRAVPYVLLKNENRVLYTPEGNGYEGGDSFTFKVRYTVNGSVPSESNEATVSIQIGIRDHLTEAFDGNSRRFDLAGKSLTLTPAEGVTPYQACLQSMNRLPIDSTGHTRLALGDDDVRSVSLDGGRTVRLFHGSYSSVWVSSNGHLLFDVADPAPYNPYNEDLDKHFGAKRVAALFDDLDPAAGGAVLYAQLPDRLVVTWMGVPEFSTGNSNTFQVEMMFDGTIRLSWLAIAALDGVVGLSDGSGRPPDLVESDLSGYQRCQPGDFDRDGDVDQTDFGHLQACLSGAHVSQPEPACAETRLDSDIDVDQDDLELFRGCMSGPNTPADRNCLP